MIGPCAKRACCSLRSFAAVCEDFGRERVLVTLYHLSVFLSVSQHHAHIARYMCFEIPSELVRGIVLHLPSPSKDTGSALKTVSLVSSPFRPHCQEILFFNLKIVTATTFIPSCLQSSDVHIHSTSSCPGMYSGFSVGDDTQLLPFLTWAVSNI